MSQFLWFDVSSAKDRKARQNSNYRKHYQYYNGDPWLMEQDYGMSDQDYFNKIEQYKDSTFYEQLKNNPYLFSMNAAFSPSAGQQKDEKKGDYSARNAYYAQLLNQSNQYYEDILGQMRQQSYDSPVAQAERERAAGINPNLAGNVTPGSAAENDQPQQPLNTMADGRGAMEVASQLSNLALQAYSFASGFVKDSYQYSLAEQQLAQGENTLVASDLAAAGSVSPLVDDFLKMTTGNATWNSEKNRWDFPDLSMQKLQEYANKHFHSARARKMFIDSVKTSYGSAKHMLTKLGTIGASEDALRSMTDSLGENVSNGRGFSQLMGSDVMVGVSSRLHRMARELYQARTEFEGRKARFDSKVISSRDPVLEGAAQNDENRALIERNEAAAFEYKARKIVSKHLFGIMNQLEDDSKEGGITGAYANLMQLYITSQMSGLSFMPGASILPKL